MLCQNVSVVWLCSGSIQHFSGIIKTSCLHFSHLELTEELIPGPWSHCYIITVTVKVFNNSLTRANQVAKSNSRRPALSNEAA